MRGPRFGLEFDNFSSSVIVSHHLTVGARKGHLVTVNSSFPAIFLAVAGSEDAGPDRTNQQTDVLSTRILEINPYFLNPDHPSFRSPEYHIRILKIPLNATRSVPRMRNVLLVPAIGPAKYEHLILPQ
jgi:hypothetical protein